MTGKMSRTHGKRLDTPTALLTLLGLIAASDSLAFQIVAAFF